MRITAPDITTAWLELLTALLSSQQLASPRAQPTREIIGVQLVVEDLLSNVIVHPARDLNYRFMVAEWVWMMLGLDDIQPLVRFNPRMAEFSDDGVKLAGAYGPRIMRQWDYVVSKLQEESATRQAVISIWTPNPTPSKDVPCTLIAHFLIRPDDKGVNKLHGIWTMRSSDVWLGIPYDFYSFSMLTNLLSAELNHLGINVTPGHLIMQLGSSHLYERDTENAKDVVWKKDLAECVKSPKLTYLDDYERRMLLLKSLYQGTIDGHGTIETPWKNYADILCCFGKREALRILRSLT